VGYLEIYGGLICSGLMLIFSGCVVTLVCFLLFCSGCCGGSDGGLGGDGCN
jgi:hypothetical protein